MEPKKIVILNKFINKTSAEIVEMAKDFIEFLSTSFIEVMEYDWITDLPKISEATFLLFLDHKILDNEEKKAAIQELMLKAGKEKVFIVMEDFEGDKEVYDYFPIFWLPDALVMRDDLDKLFLHDFIKKVLGGDKTDAEKDKIYLATAEKEYSKYRHYLKRELERRGYQILPKEDFILLTSEKDFTVENEEKIFSMMRSSSFSVHFGKQEINDRVTKFTSQKTLENNIAFQLEKALYKHDSSELNDFRRIIWDYNMTSDALSDLEYTEKQSKKTEYLHSSVDQLKTFVLRLLNDDLPQEEQSNAAKDTQKKLYIIHKYKNIDLVTDVIKQLNNSDIKLIGTELSDDFDKNRKKHHKALKECDLSLILDDEIDDVAWLNSKVHDMLKVSGLRNDNPLIHKAVFTKKEPSAISSYIEDEELDIIRYTENSIIDLIKQFVAGVKESV